MTVDSRVKDLRERSNRQHGPLPRGLSAADAHEGTLAGNGRPSGAFSSLDSRRYKLLKENPRNRTKVFTARSAGARRVRPSERQPMAKIGTLASVAQMTRAGIHRRRIAALNEQQ